jgi:hypothetical protein
MKKILLLIGVAIGMIACNHERDDESRAIGSVNDVRFSKTELSFTAQGGTDSIITEGQNWQFEGLYIDERGYDLENAYFLSAEKIAEIDTTRELLFIPSGKTVINSYGEVYVLENVGSAKGPWFIFSVDEDVIDFEAYVRRTSLTVSVVPNTTGKTRVLKLFTSFHNYNYPPLVITQAAE